MEKKLDLSKLDNTTKSHIESSFRLKEKSTNSVKEITVRETEL